MNTQNAPSSNRAVSIKCGRAFLLVTALAALAFGSPQANAAGGSETWAQSYGSRSYDPDGTRNSVDYEYASGFDWVQGIAAMPDGGYVVAGQIDLPERYADTYSNHTGDYADAALVRYAADGKILWQQQIRQTNDTMDGEFYRPAPSRVFKMLTDAQGNIFVCGDKTKSGGDVPFVAKFSPNGALLWQNGLSEVLVPYTDFSGTRLVNGGFRLPFESMALTRDGGILVGTSEGRAMSNSHSVPAIAKFNSDGSLGFHGAYEHAAQYDRTYAVAASRTDANSYLWITANHIGFSNVGITAIRVGANGAVTAERSFSREGRYETPIAAIGTDDGGFVILSQQGALSGGVYSGNYGFVVRKLNAALKPVFEKFIQRANQDRFRVDGIAATADGGFVISGTTSATEPGTPGATGTEAAIVKLTASGDLQFVSLLGGPRNEGWNGFQGQQQISTYAVAGMGGGYGLTTASYSYLAEPEFDNDKTDWWTVKTDNARKVKNFDGVMVDLPLSKFLVADNINPGEATTRFSRIPNAEAQPITSKEPGFTLEDLAKKEGINLPDVIFQGSSSPRIVSSDTAEAIIGQHFSYHIVAGFVAPDADLTYSATGLPNGFVIDPKTGVISGAPKAGSQTQTPILVTLKVNDGTDVGTLVLSLTIGFGKPAFTVNNSDEPKYPGSAAPVTGLQDTPLSFAAKYAGALAGQLIRVQASTTPGVASSWKYIQNGSESYMTYDVSTKRYVINSLNYPAKNPVYFRAIATADAFPSAISNVVGPFDLASSVPRVGGTAFQLRKNGDRADLDFIADLISTRADTTLRVESTKTPSDEASWTDLVNGSSGEMQKDTSRPKVFSLPLNQVPPDPDGGVYFRSVARSAGAADSLSNIIGPYTLQPETPPVVEITSPSASASGPDGKSPKTPLVITAGSNGTATFKITAKVTSNNFIKSLKIIVDGAVVHTVENGVTQASIDYTSNVRPHLIQALAVDEFDATARAGTSPLYISIEPASGSALQHGAAASVTSGKNAAAAADNSRTYFKVAKSGGRWDDVTTWKYQDGTPATRVPDLGDAVNIGDSTVQLGAQQEVTGFFMYESGRLLGPGTLAVHRDGSAFGGTLGAGVRFIVLPNARFQISNYAAQFRVQGIFENRGHLEILADRANGGVVVSDFTNSGAMTFQSGVVTPAAIAAGQPLSPPTLSAGSFANSGAIEAGLIAGLRKVNPGGGNIISSDGASLIGQDGAGLIGQDGAGIISSDGASLIGQDGAGIISSDGASLIGQDGAGIVAGGAGNLIGASANTTDEGRDTSAATSPSGFVQNAGETDLSGIFIRGSVTLNGGVLSGSGLIIGNLTNQAGYVSPGNSAGAITVTGNYTQRKEGTLVIEAAGGEASQFDQLRAGGTATLGGKLIVNAIDGYTPLPGDPFSPLGYESVSGSFASVTGNVQVALKPTGVLATLDPAKPNPASSKLLNISTRMKVEAGDSALIGGFIVTGTEPKKVIIRALGPTLPVDGKLLDPTLELNAAGGKTFNNNWKDTQAAAITATGVAPKDEREAAIVATLQPGQFYTAIVRGNGNTTGVGLVEVYDLDSGATSQLANISTRGLVQTGENVMIGGLIIGGSMPANVLVRGLGPSLTAQGVAGALQDPELTLVDGNGSALTNDDWRNTQEAEIAATGVPPSKNGESAIVATLVPGFYTAIIRGKDGTTGVALVEAFNLQ